MTVKDIVAAWLIANGYDGLAGEACGCNLADLMECGEGAQDCVPGYKVKCKGCGAELLNTSTKGPDECEAC